jgi:hypothetical protein
MVVVEHRSNEQFCSHLMARTGFVASHKMMMVIVCFVDICGIDDHH